MIGVGKSHYASPDQGPFKCENCEYFRKPTLCKNDVVLADAKAGKLPRMNGLAVIAPKGCCNYYEPK